MVDEFGPGGKGELHHPIGIAVLGVLREVAIMNASKYAVQIFDYEGNFKRQFGKIGDADGEIDSGGGIACDVHGNLLVTDAFHRLQVFNPDGKHLCTRDDLKLCYDDVKGIAWSTEGHIAVTNGRTRKVFVWYGR
jgi:tripartite motif-containing protein 2/3